MIYRPSPNYSLRNTSRIIDSIIIHYTDMDTAEAALDRLCDPFYEVSAHYLIDDSGQTYHMVEEEHCAFHAGVSFWRGHNKINHSSIGIELTNPGHSNGYVYFPSSQLEALVVLCKAIQRRHPSIEARNIIGHSDVAPTRKKDPGEYFDWKFLASHGIGLWKDLKKISENTVLLQKKDVGSGVSALKKQLRTYGYFTDDTEIFDDLLLLTVIAFKRHFLPYMIDTLYESLWTLEDENMLHALNGH